MLKFLGDRLKSSFMQMSIRDDQEGTDKDHKSSDRSSNGEEAGVPLIKFARFKSGTLELFEARTDELEYVAFSHVWGTWAWRRIPGIPYEVKTSEQKAEFIEKELPALVGEGAFWMDTLTVDQHDEEEVLAIVQSIPTIFTMARRTIAVRESDGLYNCCMEALDGFQDYNEFTTRWMEHGSTHHQFICNESYLQRLWTLQECMLSHTIQFVVSKNNQPEKERGHTAGDAPFYKSQIDQTVLRDSLWVLAFSFKGSEGIPGISEFLKAYVHCGTVVNPRSQLRTVEEDIHTGSFLSVNLASHRSALMPRDYIFATMPQFAWYKYPRNAITMSFGDIYTDLYMQAANTSHAFSCRFTRSMLDSDATDQVDAWLPSGFQPSPSCLGDFMKLMGHRVPSASNALSDHVQLTSVVDVKDFQVYFGPELVLNFIEISMKFFLEQWNESHRGGELSKFGNFPTDDWILDLLDAMRWGWLNKDPEEKVRLCERGDETFMYIGPSLEYEEDPLFGLFFSLDEHEHEPAYSAVDPGQVTLIEQARRILDHMWCSMSPSEPNPSQRSDWQSYKKSMRALWSQPLLHSTLLLAAMVICRVPLSAARWVNRYFVPVYVKYGDLMTTFGLLSRHARQNEAERDQPLRIFSVGQHPAHESGATRGSHFGKDLFLVDPKTKVPVGILPDFLPYDRTDEQYVMMTSVLYNGLCKPVDKKVNMLVAPLRYVSIPS